MFNNNILDKLALSGTFLMVTMCLVGHIYTMDVSDTNLYLNILPHNKKIRLSQGSFVQDSNLIKTLRDDFPTSGTLLHPFEVIIDSSIDESTLINFIANIFTESLIQQTKFLYLACYFTMPNRQSDYEYLIKQMFQKLEVSAALQQAEELQAFDLPLPDSFKHMLIAKKITQLFVKAYPLTITDDKPTFIKNRENNIDVLKKLVEKFHENNKICYWPNAVITIPRQNDATVLYGLDGNLHYFCTTMPKPLVFKHYLTIHRYAMNHAADKIVALDCRNNLVIWDTIDDEKDPINWKKTVDSSIACGFECLNIIFSDDDNLFITINKNWLSDTIIRVWDAKNNKVIAYYKPDDGDKLSSISFFAHNTQLLLVFKQALYKIFDIATQSFIRYWIWNTSEYKKQPCNYQLTHSSDQGYYLTHHPWRISNKDHQPLITLDRKSLHLPDTVKSKKLKVEFDTNDKLILHQDNTAASFIFDLVALDAILQVIPKLTLPQAIALLFFSKSLYEKSSEHSTVRRIINSLPKTIQSLLDVT